jgi:chemotaxis protein histidine kinase CheA
VDGTLSIQSAPGTGTDVRVLIPQAASLQFTQVS